MRNFLALKIQEKYLVLELYYDSFRNTNCVQYISKKLKPDVMQSTGSGKYDKNWYQKIMKNISDRSRFMNLFRKANR